MDPLVSIAYQVDGLNCSLGATVTGKSKKSNGLFCRVHAVASNVVDGLHHLATFLEFVPQRMASAL